jgi:hypothetical protein
MFRKHFPHSFIPEASGVCTLAKTVRVSFGEHNQRSCNLWPATGSSAVGNECLPLFNTPFGVCITWVSKTSKLIPVTDRSDSLKSGNLCCQARYSCTATRQVTWCGATPSQRCDFRGQFTVKCSLISDLWKASVDSSVRFPCSTMTNEQQENGGRWKTFRLMHPLIPSSGLFHRIFKDTDDFYDP